MQGQTSERNSFYEKPSLIGSSFQFNMGIFSSANSTNATNTISRESDTADVPSVAGAINIINTITFLFTVLLNLLVIKSCKVDASTPYQQRHFAGLFSGDWRLYWSLWPTIVWKIFQIFGLSDRGTVENCYATVVIVIVTASYFHLMLVTLERLLAIKFTMQYPNIVNDEKMKRAVLVAWILAFIIGVFRVLKTSIVLRSLSGLLILSCILFLAFAYFVAYRETRLQQEKIKTEQLPQKEVKRFTRENKVLKKTVFVIGAVVVCLLPLCFCLIVTATGLCDICPIPKIDANVCHVKLTC